MGESEFEPFPGTEIVFEPFTGFLGGAPEVIPEPISAMTLSAEALLDRNSRLVEHYWLKASDAAGFALEPQAVAHSFDFTQVAALCSAVFECCGKTAGIRVGFGFAAYRNRLTRRLNVALPDGPVQDVLCSVVGEGGSAVQIRFSSGDSASETVSMVRGRLPAVAIHSLASSFRDLAEWRADVIERLPEVKAARVSARSSSMSDRARGSEARVAEASVLPGFRR